MSPKNMIDSNESTQKFHIHTVMWNFPSQPPLVLLYGITPNRVLCCSTEPSKTITRMILHLSSLLCSSRGQGGTTQIHWNSQVPHIAGTTTASLAVAGQFSHVRTQKSCLLCYHILIMLSSCFFFFNCDQMAFYLFQL